jgi:stage II sporulation protein D
MMASASSTGFPLYWLFRAIAGQKRYWWATVLLWLLWVLPACALELRIAVSNDVDRVDIGSSTPGIIRDGSGRALYQLPQLQSITVDDEAGKLQLTDGRSEFAEAQSFWLEPTENGVVWIGDRWYRGKVLVIPSQGGVTAINYVDLEQYLYSVVGSEMPASWPQQALQSQAVAARSYALYHRNRTVNRPYDMGGTQSWQVYRGLSGEAPTTIAAVNATAGQVITYGGQVIEAVFHSSSGGYTANAEDVWSNPVPYLKAVQDFDQAAPVYAWDVRFTLAEVSQRITGVGQIRDIQIADVSSGGRVKQVRVIGSAGQRTLKGSEFRTALGLRSTKFSLAIAPASQTLRITGQGFGHGIGLSQWGARAMADQGSTYDAILLHYYQGTTLAQLGQ